MKLFSKQTIVNFAALGTNRALQQTPCVGLSDYEEPSLYGIRDWPFV